MYLRTARNHYHLLQPTTFTVRVLGDLALRHDFHKTVEGVSFTVRESVRRVVLSRLLRLNEEQRMNDEGGGMKVKKSKSAGDGQMGLL